MSSLRESLPGLHDALTGRGGTPATPLDDEPFRAIVRVYLGQFCTPTRAGAILDALEGDGSLDPASLVDAEAADLGRQLVRSGGAGASKLAAPLKRLAGWAAGRLDGLDRASTETLRDELRGLRGVGPATADAILLHALGRAAYPVDRGTYRILVRHSWIDPTADYDEARDTIEHAAGSDPAALRSLSAGLESVGGAYCRPSVAKCERCPLRPFLPEGGPRPASAEDA